MLFNSYTFLFLFIPVVLGLYWLSLRFLGARWVTGLLIAASLFFYGWWSVSYLWLLAFSIMFNYTVGKALTDWDTNRQVLFWSAIGCNLGLLGYFKYTNFFVAELNHYLGLTISNDTILLPLAISFFTFQQIAYLVDCRRGHSVAASFPQYALFVAFFPQLIAGPIVRSSEILPQIKTIWSRNRDVMSDVAVGLSLFTIGLAKKVILADSMAEYAAPVFGAADSGVTLTFAEAWIGALAYTFQLYFDFSGYSDMAIGLARLFGIHLPINFFSPYRATSIAEFWRRWHITLSRFLREYLYIPLGGNRRGATRQSINLLITMLLGGIWHGAGWTFLIWGGLHGLYLVINRWWHDLGLFQRSRNTLPWLAIAWALTFVAIVVGWVLFRAHTVSGALAMLGSMFGLNGFSFPADYQTLFPFLVVPLEVLGADLAGNQILWKEDKTNMALLFFLSIIIVFLTPNTARLFNLAERKADSVFTSRSPVIVFATNHFWLFGILVLFLASVFQMTDVSEFLYYQF